MKTFKFVGLDCHLRAQTYRDSGRLAIELIAAESDNNIARDVMPGEPVAVLSSNIEHADVREGEIAVKNWSENATIEEAVPAGLLEYTGRYVNSGYVRAPICKVNKAILAEFSEPEPIHDNRTR